MKQILQSLVLLLAALMVPTAANAAYVQLEDGVYSDGSTLYIGSGVTSLGNLQINPSEIYCYATLPPACVFNTFTGYGATLHVPTTAMINYFSAQYWYNFTNLVADAIEPESVTMSKDSVELGLGKQLTLSASVSPATATPNTITWTSTNTAIATVDKGVVTTVAPGECDIIAWCAGKQAVCHVTVITEFVTITLNNHEARMLPNHLLTLTVTCSPIPVDLIVQSSDSTIAMPRLVNGLIQVVGLKEGTAIITVGSPVEIANTDSCVVTVYTECGDVNSDGYVNIGDLTKLIDYVLGTEVPSFNVENADTDRDGRVTLLDVTRLVDYLLGFGWPWDLPQNKWIDLGLPSGTLWATCNVGATNPEDYGDYFAWGETEPKDNYDWSTYKWCNGSFNTLTKYCTYNSYGTVDNKTELDLEDDAAYVNWGSSWRMPSEEQMEEIRSLCSWEWTQINGVNGQLATGPNGNTIFFPATGRRYYSSILNVGTNGFYWTRSLGSGYPHLAFDHFFDSGSVGSDGYSRYSGFTVRAVRIPED